MISCKNCGTDTNDKLKGISLCKSCRELVKSKRDEMTKDYDAKLEALKENPTNMELFGELSSIKRGSIMEALEELTKE